MSNIDELLIDVQLKERPTTTLPWDNKYGEERNVKQDEETFREYNDIRPSRHENDIARYMSINSQDEPTNVSSSHVDRGNVSEKYNSNTGLTGHSASYQRDSQDEASSMWKDIDKLKRYEPSFGASRLPGSVKVFNTNGFDRKAILPANPCTRVPNSVSSLKESAQEDILTKSKRNTTTSVKVSRHMIQEAKLGYQASLRSEIATQTVVDKPENSVDTLLINKDTYEHKSVTTQTMSNSKQSVISQARRNEQFNMGLGTSMQRTDLRRFTATKRQEIADEINELNDLLDVTGDAMNPGSFRNKTIMGSSTRINGVLMKGQSTYRSNGGLVKGDQKSQCSASIDKQSNSNTVGNEFRNGKAACKGRKEAGSKSNIVDLKQDDEHSVSSDSISISRDRITKSHKSAKAEVEEDPGEILQFVCQMMDIKQPRLMSRKKKCASPAGTQNHENDKIDYAKVEEQNKKSEELFWKKIREGKKTKNKKPTIIHVVPEPDKVRARKTKEKVEKHKSFTVVHADARSSVHRLAVPAKMVESEADVFDIAPAQDRNDFYNSDPDTADYENQKTCKDTNTDIDFVEQVSVKEAHLVKPAKSYTVMRREQGSRFTVTNNVTRSISSLKQSKTKNKRKKVKVMTVTSGADKGEIEANNNTKYQACKIINRLSSDGKEKFDIETKSCAGQSPLSDRSDDDTNVKYEQHTDTRENFVNKTRNVTPVTDLADIMYTSEDTHTDSDYSSCGDYFSRSATAQSRALPRPASNTTYILNTNDEDFPHPGPENDAVLVTEESNINNIDNNENENKRVEKLNRVQRFWRWLACCVRPKSDD